jgi:uncharacterized protein YidB (DUF937 family)
MGLLDSLLGSVLGGMAQRGGSLPGGIGMERSGQLPGLGGGGGSGLGGAGMAAIIAIALQLLQRHGGIEGVLGRMRDTGHGAEADSWVGTGQNMPVSPDVLSEIFGRDEVSRSAREMGVDPDAALGGLADVFPEVINQITPHGQVESGSDDLVARALEDLQRSGR